MPIDKTVHVVTMDHCKTMPRIILEVLRQTDLNDDEAADDRQALLKLSADNYGMVISDWNMQPMTGLELLTEVQQDPTLTSLPFIMATARSQIENIVGASRAGVTNYIVEQFNAETLRGDIEKVLCHA